MNNLLLHCGDAFERLKEIPAHSVDLILTDPPYGTTNFKWDTKLDLSAFWTEIERIRKPNAPAVIFSSTLFTFSLYNSNPKEYRYRFIWHKQGVAPVGFLDAKKKPLHAYEEISVFYAKQPTYNPQFVFCERRRVKNWTTGTSYFKPVRHDPNKPLHGYTDRYYPTDILTFKALHGLKRKHPNQKPVELLQWLIKTYTNAGDVVCDPFMGSGSCGVAAISTGRDFIGVEKDQEYFEAACQWINNTPPFSTAGENVPFDEAISELETETETEPPDTLGQLSLFGPVGS